MIAAGHDALLDELLLHRVAGDGQGRGEVLTRGCVPTALQFELTERDGIERVAAEPLAVGDRAQGRETALGPLMLRDGYRPVEGYHRRWPYGHQCVVE